MSVLRQRYKKADNVSGRPMGDGSHAMADCQEMVLWAPRVLRGKVEPAKFPEGGFGMMAQASRPDAPQGFCWNTDDLLPQCCPHKDLPPLPLPPHFWRRQRLSHRLMGHCIHRHRLLDSVYNTCFSRLPAVRKELGQERPWVLRRSLFLLQVQWDS